MDDGRYAGKRATFAMLVEDLFDLLRDIFLAPGYGALVVVASS